MISQIRGARRVLSTILLCLLVGLPAWAAEKVIQVDVRSILNGRAVTTLSGGKLVPWTDGIDGGGRADGYLTLEAAMANGDKDAKALPGDGCFKANGAHPFVRLNFSNADGKRPQTRSVEGAGELSFPVSKKPYKRMLLFLTSSEGPSRLHLTLLYADNTQEQREVLLPDYYNDAPTGDPNVFSLATDLAKWDASGRMRERDHHNIHGVDLHPNPDRKLVSVRLSKTAPGYLVFWGATGMTAK